MKTNSFLIKTALHIKNHPFITSFGVIAGILAVGAYSYFSTPVYESTAVIENPSPRENSSLSLFGDTKSALSERITGTQFLATTFQDKTIPATTYISQDFHTRATTYGFPFDIQFKQNNKSFTSQEYSIRENGTDHYILTSDVHGIIREKTAKFGEELVDQNVTLIISHKKNTIYFSEPIIGSNSYSFKIQSAQNLAEELSSNASLYASDQNGILTIKCSHESPQIAQQIVSAISRQLTGQQTETVAGNPYESQLADISHRIETSEKEIADYKQQNNITDENTETAKILGVINQLEMQKTELELEKVALYNTTRYLRKYRAENNSNVDYGAVADPVFSEQMSQLNEKYEAKTNGTASSNVDTEIEALKTLVAERIRNTRKKNVVKLHRINEEISVQNAALATLPVRYQELNNLDRKLALDKKLFDVVAEKRAQAMLTGTPGGNSFTIIKSATIDFNPSQPAPWMLILTGLITAFFIIVPGISLSEHFRQQRIRNRETLDQLTKIPFIGTISTNSITAKEIDASISKLCTAVLLKSEVKHITFAASESGTGKDFIALRFAQALAAMDKKVLIMDMDHSDNPLSGLLDANPEHILSDVLKGTCDVHDAIALTSYPNLDLLRGGELEGGINTLLASKNRVKIFDDLKKHYDIIVTDTPDIGIQIDAIPMMKSGDLSLFVVKANTTRKKSLVVAEQIKKDYNIENLCLLLNTVRPSGITKRTSGRVKVQPIETATAAGESKFIPGMLRKIALWFY